MLHTKFCENWPDGSGEGFYHICDPDAENKISFPLPKEATHKIWL